MSTQGAKEREGPSLRVNVLTAAPSAVTCQLDGTTRIDIFARGGDFVLYQLYWSSGSGWHGWYDLGLTS